MYANILIAAGLLGLAQAQSYTPPKSQTFGSLYTPEGTHAVITGETFQVTWDPTGHTTDGSTISLVLCKGGSSNCVNAPTAIVTGVPAKNAQYTWSVPCSLAPAQQDSTTGGYGMLIIVDGTGEFQYSTQFSVVTGESCGSSASSSTTTSKASGSSTSTITTTSKPSSSSVSASTWLTWSAPKNSTTTPYVTTSYKPTTQAPVMTTASTSAAPVVTSAPSASSTQFRGAATQVGASAAALILAAGAAFFAL